MKVLLQVSACRYILLILSSETLSGKWEKIGGVDCYVNVPTMEYAKDKALLYISDVFGPQLVNHQVCTTDSRLQFPYLMRAVT